MTRPRDTRRRIREYALGLPGAWEDHPWDEDVAKVGKKVFVFLGTDGSPEPGMWVKLHDSHEQALAAPGVEPATYGLGRSGWVMVAFGDEVPPLPVLKDWVEESYRLVAPKKLVAEIEARTSPR